MASYLLFYKYFYGENLSTSVLNYIIELQDIKSKLAVGKYIMSTLLNRLNLDDNHSHSC